jgi:hypothetical protein
MSHVVNLTGVVDDGGDLDSSVPADTAQTITAPRGGTLALRVHLVNNGGVPTDLRRFTTWFGTLNIRDASNPARANVGKSWTATQPAGTTDVLLFSVASSDLRFWTTGRYWFDVWLTGDSVVWQVVNPSILVLMPSLTL